MKIILEDKDLNVINSINKVLKDDKDIPLFINSEDQTYYIGFKCLDIGKANLFANLFLSNNKDTCDLLKENFGIKGVELRYNIISIDERNDLRSKLMEIIDSL